jgi:uncharacterized LabA/DUF88 family protein
MELFILVDYDNIKKHIRNRGMVYIADKIISKLEYNEIKQYKRVRMRLYGGWYEENSLTAKAQLLSSDVLYNFPSRINFVKDENSHSVIIVVELAYSTCIDPRSHLFSTYRTRMMPMDLKCLHPNTKGCSNLSCSLIKLYDHINNKSLRAGCCNLRAIDLVYKGEQKLIDAMLLCDLIYLSREECQIVIVSSDDDFWPGIKTAIILGVKVIQVHTRNRMVPITYTNNITKLKYMQRML